MRTEGDRVLTSHQNEWIRSAFLSFFFTWCRVRSFFTLSPFHRVAAYSKVDISYITHLRHHVGGQTLLKSGLNLQGGNADAPGHGHKRKHLLQTHTHIANSYQSINQHRWMLYSWIKFGGGWMLFIYSWNRLNWGVVNKTSFKKGP